MASKSKSRVYELKYPVVVHRRNDKSSKYKVTITAEIYTYNKHEDVSCRDLKHGYHCYESLDDLVIEDGRDFKPIFYRDREVYNNRRKQNWLELIPYMRFEFFSFKSAIIRHIGNSVCSLEPINPTVSSYKLFTRYNKNIIHFSLYGDRIIHDCQYSNTTSFVREHLKRIKQLIQDDFIDYPLKLYSKRVSGICKNISVKVNKPHSDKPKLRIKVNNSRVYYFDDNGNIVDSKGNIAQFDNVPNLAEIIMTELNKLK